MTPTRFAAGAAVPEWLIAVYPRNGKSERPSVTFMVDVTVVELDNQYWVLPKPITAREIIGVAGDGDYGLSCASWPVLLPLRIMNIGGNE